MALIINCKICGSKTTNTFCYDCLKLIADEWFDNASESVINKMKQKVLDYRHLKIKLRTKEVLKIYRNLENIIITKGE